MARRHQVVGRVHHAQSKDAYYERPCHRRIASQTDRGSWQGTGCADWKRGLGTRRGPEHAWPVWRVASVLGAIASGQSKRSRFAPVHPNSHDATPASAASTRRSSRTGDFIEFVTCIRNMDTGPIRGTSIQRRERIGRRQQAVDSWTRLTIQ